MYPVLFKIGTLPIRSYGTLIVIGFLVCLWRATHLVIGRQKTVPVGSPRRIHPDDVFDVGLLGLMVGILGARLLFVLLDWNEYRAHPLQVLKVWEGGLSLHGGMLFGILTMVLVCRHKKISILAVGDVGAPSWAIAYCFGRIGCLLNGCCYGGVCNLPWAMRFHEESNPALLTPPSHPTQLYAVLFNIVFFLILVRWEKRPRRDGELFYGYIAMYGFYRFVVEFFREGVTSTDRIPALHITDTHIISIVMMALGIGAIVWLRHTRPAYSDGELPPPTLAGVSAAKA